MSRLAVSCALFVLAAGAFTPERAHAWEWRDLLRSDNGHVDDGNERMRAGDHEGALAAYDEAAKQLPSEGGVHLNRGLALLAAGDLPKARESFLRATEPPATADVRAAAYYNLGLAFYRDGDARAAEDEHKDAQAMFREAADALKRSLRLVPGNHDAAWNLELALRRLRDEQEKQRQQEEQEQKDKQEQQDQEKQDGEDSENKESQDGEQQPQDGEQKPQDGEQQDPPENQDAEKQQQPQDGEQEPEPGEEPQEQQPQEQPQEARPSEAERALDALQQGEENLERMRARQRAGRERREPSKDW